MTGGQGTRGRWPLEGDCIWGLRESKKRMKERERGWRRGGSGERGGNKWGREVEERNKKERNKERRGWWDSTYFRVF